MLNDVVFAGRPDVQLRVYGHYGVECELAFLRVMSNVRNFAADSLMRATHVEAIAELRLLDSLKVGIYELESFEFLHDVDPALISLFLGRTRSAKPGLEPLERFRSLKTVYIEGHSRGLAVLSTLKGLEDVTLRSVTTQDLSYLIPLTNMWSLDLKLGGIKSIDAISGMDGIKYLELWRIRGLSDITVISDLPGLQFLFLQSLAHVIALPDLQLLRRLRRVVLETMKGIRDLRALESSPSLEEFAYFDARGKEPTLLLPALRNPAVRRVTAGFGSKKKNDEFARLRDEWGKAPLDGLPKFEFQ